MTLHQLKIFSSVAKLFNVTKAAAELHISQPSVSQQLKLLQEEHGKKLYKKDGRGIQLTETGRAFLKDIEPILVQVETLKRKFGRARAENSSASLAIGGSHSPSAIFLPFLATAFRESHPEARVTLRTNNSLAMEQMLLDSEVEIAVTTNPSGHPFLVYETARKVKVAAFAATRHPLAQRPELTLGELAKAPVVLFKRGRIGGLAEIVKRIEQRGFQLNVAMHCESTEAVKTAVKAGLGLGLLYRDVIEPEIQGGHVKVVKIAELNMMVDTFIVYHRDRPLSPYARDFLALLRKWPQKMRCLNGVSRTV